MIKSYDELSIKKYRELIGLEKVDGEDMEYGIEILSILTDIDQDTLMEMPLEKFTKYMSYTRFLYEPVMKKDYKELGKTIRIGDEEYRMVQSARELTAGQYIDYKAYISRDNFLEMLPYILTVFLIPKGKKYNNGYDILELKEKFDNEVDIPTALSISDFFLHQSKLSMLSSVTYLKWKVKRMVKTEKNPELREKMTECLEQMSSLEGLLRVSDGYILP